MDISAQQELISGISGIGYGFCGFLQSGNELIFRQTGNVGYGIGEQLIPFRVDFLSVGIGGDAGEDVFLFFHEEDIAAAVLQAFIPHEKRETAFFHVPKVLLQNRFLQILLRNSRNRVGDDPYFCDIRMHLDGFLQGETQFQPGNSRLGICCGRGIPHRLSAVSHEMRDRDQPYDADQQADRDGQDLAQHLVFRGRQPFVCHGLGVFHLRRRFRSFLSDIGQHPLFGTRLRLGAVKRTCNFVFQ